MGKVKSNVILRPSTISLHNSSLKKKGNKIVISFNLDMEPWTIIKKLPK